MRFLAAISRGLCKSIPNRELRCTPVALPEPAAIRPN